MPNPESSRSFTAVPDWQLPVGVDRGLWDYVQSSELAAGYDEQIRGTPLAQADTAYCREWFSTPGRLLDLGCATGRLVDAMRNLGHQYVGIDLSEEMLRIARASSPTDATFVCGNLVELSRLALGEFDYASCLFSTFGMIRGADHRQTALREVHQVLKRGGRFVLHVHNRWYPATGWRRFVTAERTMPQAYAGAPLTLHHFTRSEVVRLLRRTGFRVLDCRAVSANAEPPGYWPYGYLFAAEKV